MLKDNPDIPRDYCEVTLRLAGEREGDKARPRMRLGFGPNKGMLHNAQKNLKL